MRLFLFICLLIVSCNSKENKEKYNHKFYRAVNNKDTAVLDIKINDKRFYGRYEISHYGTGKDSGDVRGDLRGDTLRGDYHYISFGGGWKRVPLALLKRDNKLYLGKGVIGTYFNLPCFVPDVPIEYNNSEFVFEEVTK
ncbi:hypothetical protein [Flavobacterium phragmitis]|uniref:Uncharacterized protein n=1 Tax=Flavobacterium phragmitis TaxID=739143 RepID=A0A1I1W7G1_9FLAO|nr:hypothetical protein [Flavobacterium phragmitis]SFD91052.1 hypothetical protein SAMN05216297_114117 [Flavobacterium phragmitis]